ncbi:MAG: hypothetical protein QNJ07_13235 [Woeseiaceae bacterium]|nr:hypothetical protein [Woeseiaceae bacterium]
MSSSKRSIRQQVHLRSESGPIEIKLLNKELNVVASGLGELRRKVEPGLYLARFDSGTDEDERFITVSPGEDYEDLRISLPIRSAAPLAGTGGFDEAQARAVANCSLQPQITVGEGGRLLVFVRNSEKHRSNKINLSDTDIRSSEGELLAKPDQAAMRSYDEGWACCSIDVPEGGYVVRWHNKWHSRWDTAKIKSNVVDQSMWVQSGWTTALFLNTDSRKDFRPRMTGMSVQMRRMESGFRHDGDDADTRINQVNQLAINSIIYGDALVPTDLIKLVRHEQHGNPMVGILGAHALLQEYVPRWTYFDDLVRALFKIAPTHPDVVALRVLGKEYRRDKSHTRSEMISWPPMIYAGYRGLIDRDFAEGGLIGPESHADTVAVRLLPQGPWTVWSHVEDAVAEEATAVEGVLRERETVDRILKEVQKRLRSKSRAAVAEIGKPETISDAANKADPAVGQVADFLDTMQSGKQWPDAKTIASQISQVGLPVSTVVRALHTMKGMKS